jgi:hypothetical protein
MSSPNYIIVSYTKDGPIDTRGGVHARVQPKIEVFQDIVNKKINEGYVPIGNMNIFMQPPMGHINSFVLFTQGMIKSNT